MAHESRGGWGLHVVYRKWLRAQWWFWNAACGFCRNRAESYERAHHEHERAVKHVS